MNALRLKLVRVLRKIPEYVPDWSKPILRPFSGIYSKVYGGVYSSISSIKEEELVKTPMGPYIHVNYWDIVERDCAIGSWERRYMDFFCSKIKEGDVVVDIGAYIGIFSLLASERASFVYSFEPVPRNYERLIRNIKANKAENIKAYNLGLSDRNEILSISVPTENPAESTLCQSNWTEISEGIKMQKDIVKAKLIPFDQFYKDEGLNKVNVVKIDVDGAELKVLKGMRNTLMDSDDVELFLEVIPPLIDQLGGSVIELVELLIECGFKTMYSTELNSEINLSKLNDNDIITTFGDGSLNYIFHKGKVK